MKKRLFPITQHKNLRWLMSAAVLLYVLVPNIGVCHCSGCNCCEHSDSPDIAAVAEQPEPSSCCSKQIPVPAKQEKTDSESCPCLLAEVPDTAAFITSQPISLPDIFSDGLKIDLYAPMTIVPVAAERFVSSYHSFETPTSRLPVRLYLLLLVLLN
jgi:hypothetical protein